MVELLLEAGANNVGPETHSRKLLEVAAAGAHDEVVKLLLKAKVDVDALSDLGVDPGAAQRTALQAAAGGGYAETVEILLRSGARVNAAAGHRGRTALQAAVAGGRSMPSEQVRMGGTALQIACGAGDMEMVELLLAAEAKPSARASPIR